MSNFDSNGNYNKTNWKAGDKITADKLNKIEDSLEAINNNDIARYQETDSRLEALEDTLESDKQEMNIKIEALEDTLESDKQEMNIVKVELESFNEQLEQKADLNSLYYLNVKDFGVKGDGITDDTEKIQELFNYIRDNDISSTVFFPSGEYLISEKISINKSNVIIKGEKDKTIIKSSTYHETFSFDNTLKYEHITFCDLNFEGLLSNEGQGFIKFNGAINVSAYNCSFKNCGGAAIANTKGDVLENFYCFNNIFVNTNEAGLLLRPVRNIYIHDNYFEGINGYSSSEPAHPIYIRADGANNLNCLENVYVYNNIIRNCNLEDYSGKHAIKVVVNSTQSGMDYRGFNINVYGNNISSWTVGIHLGGIINGLVNNNDLRLESTLNSNALLFERCEQVEIKNNYIDCVYGNVYNCGISISSSSDIAFENNTINYKGYNCLKIVDERNLSNLRNYSICNNIINGQSNASDRYGIVLSGVVNNIDIINNTISHDVRCIHLGTSTVDNFKIINNVFTHKTNEIGTSGVGVSKSSATLSNFVQAGNTFIDFGTPNSTENDISIRLQ